jgi:hypothetical protein
MKNYRLVMLNGDKQVLSSKIVACPTDSPREEPIAADQRQGSPDAAALAHGRRHTACLVDNQYAAGHHWSTR